MDIIIKSILDKSTDEHLQYVNLLMDPEKKVLLSPQEENLLLFLKESIDNSGQTPSEDYVVNKFPEYKVPLSSATPIEPNDLKVHYSNLIKKRTNQNASKALMTMASEVSKTGLTIEHLENIRAYANIIDDSEVTDITDSTTAFREYYERKKTQPSGMLTFIKEIDNKIGGLPGGMMLTLAGFVGSFKCVSEDERVLTNKGLMTMKEIYNLGVDSGLEVLSAEGMRKLSAVHDEGIKDSIILDVRGKSIEVSPVHRFRVLRDSKLQWVESKDIVIGDKICVKTTVNDFNGPISDPDKWYLIGLMLGDGGYSDSNGLYVMAEESNESVLRLEELFSKYTDKFYVTRMAPRKQGYRPQVRYSSKVFNISEIEELKGTTSDSKYLPKEAFYLDDRTTAALLRGLFDTDGCCGKDLGFCSNSRVMLEQISKLLMVKGIPSYLIKVGIKGYRLIITGARFRNRFMEWVGCSINSKRIQYDGYKGNGWDLKVPVVEEAFNLRAKLGLSYSREDYKNLNGLYDRRNKGMSVWRLRQIIEQYPEFRKSDYFREIYDNDYIVQEVSNITYGKVYMYDLTVEGSPTYVVNGLVTHNTTLAANIAYNNAKKLKYNICYISLEVPKEDLMYNLLCRHSFESKFTEYPFIPHSRIRQCILTEDEESYLMGTVLEDFYNEGGEIRILDETDFKTFSFSEIRERLGIIDDELLEKTGYGLDAVIVDHANLCKFNGSGKKSTSEGAEINQYISFFRKLAISFRRDKDTGDMRKLAMVVLAQVNREGWKRAVKNKGRYDLRALAEANEMERASQLIMTVFTDDNMKMAKEATVQLLKNRNGMTAPDPISIFVDPEAYVAGEEMEGFNDMISMSDIEDVFSMGSIADMF